ncbi:MAG: hypothetical protein MZV63_34040 [Marinilabiliales bacterium]|nr:hypothetical protein [Marinilabiliales bacterium]
MRVISAVTNHHLAPFRFALAETALPGDIRFNEILFNPWPEEYDFVELVNVSDRCIDATRLLLLSRNPSTGSESSAYTVCSESRCILPGDYFTVTVDPRLLVTRFSGAARCQYISGFRTSLNARR